MKHVLDDAIATAASAASKWNGFDLDRNSTAVLVDPRLHNLVGIYKPVDLCQVKGCNVGQEDRAMCFKGMPYCSDNHRKILEGEISNGS